MRVGIAASIFAHVALITLGLVSLTGVESLEPEQIESISIDLIPIEAFSNIRIGTEESDIIETDAPSVVETPDPAQLAERTGNTEEDQIDPQDTPEATPAPTLETAPAPEVRPEEEPETEPEVVAEPEPAPEPETAPERVPQTEPTPVEPDPVISVTPEVVEEPAVVAPVPVLKTAAIDQKRADFKRKQEEEAKKRAKEREQREAEEAKEADRISDIINDEDSRGATTGTGGQATAGKETGQAARLTQSERDALAARMREKWLLPPVALSGTEPPVRLLVELNRDGSVAGTRVLSEVTTSAMEALVRSAQRAVLKGSPYRLAADKYDEWRQVDVTFDPRDAF